MKPGIRINIITCPQWGARPPKQGLELVKKSTDVLIHHTAGHAKHLARPRNRSRAEAIRYARDIQAYHMSQGWTDSGHNFLVMRSGLILQGRWLTVSSIKAGHMVHSAHCPGMNGQIGIEHEHVSGEKITKAQFEASARLQAWIADCYGRRIPLRASGHKDHYATACPDNLYPQIKKMRARAAQIMRSSQL